VAGQDAFDRGPVRAAAYVPLGAYGVVSVGSTEPGGIDAFDVRLLEILAHNVAGVLERIEREGELRRARDRAEEASRLKAAMLANMSHEIRTPLTSIIGFAEALTEAQAEDDPAKRHRFADRIHRSSLRLHDTLNAVLQLAKLEADAQSVEYEYLDVGAVAREVTDLRRDGAREKGVTLTLDLPDADGETDGVVGAWCDTWALQRLTDNLVDNAIKFTPEGGRVTVRVRPCHTADDRDTDDDRAAACLEVIDTGIGMSAAFQAKMYESFTQESEGMQRAYEGGGLGLAIVHRLAQLLRATLEVESAPGAGTHFTVTLPALPPSDLHDDAA
jgi:signal transduction histidine kinase